MNLDLTSSSSRTQKSTTQKKSYKPKKSNTKNTRKSAKAPSNSLFRRLGWLCLGEEEEVLVLQSDTMNTWLNYMRARRKRIPCSILPPIEIAVDLHAAIVTAVTRIPLFPKPSSPFGENKQKPLLIWFQEAYLWELSRSFATQLSLPSDWRGDGSFFCDREWKWKWKGTSTPLANIAGSKWSWRGTWKLAADPRQYGWILVVFDFKFFWRKVMASFGRWKMNGNLRFSCVVCVWFSGFLWFFWGCVLDVEHVTSKLMYFLFLILFLIFFLNWPIKI